LVTLNVAKHRARRSKACVSSEASKLLRYIQHDRLLVVSCYILAAQGHGVGVGVQAFCLGHRLYYRG
jgi:hypothetical protein